MVATLQSDRSLGQSETLAAGAQVGDLSRARGVSALLADESAVLVWTQRPEVPS